MKKFILGFLIASTGMSAPVDGFAQYKAPCFRPSASANLQGLSTNYVITSDSIINIPLTQTISSLFISGQSFFNNNYDSHVRVVLCDSYNTEYLIYESFPLLTDSNVNAFSKTAIETCMLSNITPQSLIFSIRNAHISIDSIYTTEAITINNGHLMAIAANKNAQDSLIVEGLNQKLTNGNKTWRARRTSISELTYEEKKELFGGMVPALYGFEYYSHGVFVLPNYEQQIAQGQNPEPINSQFTEEWDWRNRHGKNWLTAVKSQGSCASCWAFSAVGIAEAYTNLYFNQILNTDLSEQEIISCANAGNCQSGGSLFTSLNYLCTNGVVNEVCFPYSFSNNSCNNKCVSPEDRVSVENKEYVYCYTQEDSLKKEVIRSPTTFGIRPWWHFLVLAGYKKIIAGEQYHSTPNSYSTITILSDNPLVGHAAWLLKNSWGTNWGDNGYCHVALNLNDAYEVYTLNGGVNSELFDDSDIICEDADGDGYFNWGIGNRPSTCPSWAPLEKDGDDSDYTKGPLTQYGFITEINPNLNDTLFIDQDTLFNEKIYSHKHIVVRNNSKLTIKNILTCYKGVKIIVQNGSSLIVDGGTIENAILLPMIGCELIFTNDGRARLNRDVPFNIPKGAFLYTNHCKIEYI